MSTLSSYSNENWLHWDSSSIQREGILLWAVWLGMRRGVVEEGGQAMNHRGVKMSHRGEHIETHRTHRVFVIIILNAVLNENC